MSEGSGSQFDNIPAKESSQSFTSRLRSAFSSHKSQEVESHSTLTETDKPDFMTRMVMSFDSQISASDTLGLKGDDERIYFDIRLGSHLVPVLSNVKHYTTPDGTERHVSSEIRQSI